MLYEKNITPTVWTKLKKPLVESYQHLRDNPADLVLVLGALFVFDISNTLDDIAEDIQ